MAEALSPVGTLNKTDWKKIGMGALMAMGGVLLAYLPTVMSDIDWGQYAFIAIPVASILINFLRKLLEGK